MALSKHIQKILDSAKKEINKGHSTRHKANKPMTFLDEVLEQKERDATNEYFYNLIINKIYELIDAEIEKQDGLEYVKLERDTTSEEYLKRKAEMLQQFKEAAVKDKTNTQTSTANDFYKYTTDKTTSQQDVVYDYTDGKKDSKVVEWVNKKTREKEKIRIYKDSFISNYPLHEPPFVLIELNKRTTKKETENKVDYSEIDWQFIEQLAKRMNKNKGKYPVNNWKKFSDVNELQQALLRHTLEVLNGNYADDNSEFGHLEAIALNAQFINYQLKNK